MENIIKFEMTDETNGLQNSVFIPESYGANTVIEIPSTELDQSPVGTEAINKQSVEICPGLEEKIEDRVQGFFGSFGHHMRPDLELIRLEFEKSASNQEAATKLIKDRYKLIMDNSARRKEKEQKDKIKFPQVLQNVDLENVMKTFQLSDAGSEDIEKTTQLLHNMYLTPGSSSKDQPEEFSDDYPEGMCWYNGLNQFTILNDIEINTKSNISDDDMPNTITLDCECRVEDALKTMTNELIDEGRYMTLYQASRMLSSAKCQNNSQIIFGIENEVIGSSFEELLDYKRS